MSKPDANRQKTSWMGRMIARSREALRRMKLVGDGAKSSRGWMIGLVVCALLVGGISLAALGREGAAKNEATAAASANTATNANAAPAPKKAAKNQANSANEEQKPDAAKDTQNQSAEQSRQAAASANSAPFVPPPPPPQREDKDYLREREEWFLKDRRLSDGSIATGLRLKALQHVDAMRAAEKLRGVNSNAALAPTSFPGPTSWTLIGPQPLITAGPQITPFNGGPNNSGRVAAIAVDPKNRDIAYLGAAAGGVWKTTNAGALWTPMTDSLKSILTAASLPTGSIGSIAIDPTTTSCGATGPCQIIYVGTGEANNSGDSYYGVGILKSMDGGNTWVQQGASSFVGIGSSDRTDGGAHIGAMAVDPSNTQIVLAGVQFFSNPANSGIYRTTNGGTNWALVATMGGATGSAIVFDPTNTGVVYAALGEPFAVAQNGVYRSTDHGATWTKLNGTGANPFPAANVGRIDIDLARSTVTTLYAAVAKADGTGFLGMFKTIDSGTNWTNLTGTPDACTFLNNGTPESQCLYDLTVRVDPNDANTVFYGGSAQTANQSNVLFRSSDGGTTWTTANAGANGASLHADLHALTFAIPPAADRLYVGCDGGIWSTDNPTVSSPASINYTDLNSTLAITMHYPGHTADVSDENSGLAGQQDNGAAFYGGSLAWNEVLSGDGGYTAQDRLLPSTVYTTAEFISIFQSQVGGNPNPPFNAFFSFVTNGINPSDRSSFIAPLVHDESISGRLYFGTFQLYMTADAANSWNSISPDLTGGPFSSINAIAVSRSDSNMVYVGTDASGTTSRIQRTTNALSSSPTWTDLTNAATLPTDRTISSIAVDRDNPDLVYVAFSGFSGCQFCNDTMGHVFRSSDGGTTWQDISGTGGTALPNAPANSILVDPQLPNTVIVATDVGVFRTADASRGTSTVWTTYGTGLPNVVVLGLTGRDSRIVRASTSGRSTWAIQDNNVPIPPGPALTSLHPAIAVVGSATITGVVVDGANFTATSQVQWNGSSTGITTHFTGNANQLTIDIDVSLLATAQVANVTVADSSQIPNLSGKLRFTVVNPLPGLTFLTPGSTNAGTSVTLTMTGSNFVCGANPTQMIFNGVFHNPDAGAGNCTPTQLIVTIPPAETGTPGIVHVSAFNPPPGGGGGEFVIGFFNFIINGVGVATAGFNPAALSFGNQATTTTSAAQTVTLTSTGVASLTTTSITKTGANGGDFVLNTSAVGACNPAGQVLTTGQSCTFAVSFAPTASGPRSASITVADNETGSPQVINLSGAGVVVSALSVDISPNTADFASTAVGNTSSQQFVHVTNNGTSTLNLGAQTITGTNPGDFAVVAPSTGTNCAGIGTLAVNKSCVYALTFAPSASGTRTATLNIADNAPGNPHSVFLIGPGTGGGNPVPTTASISPTSATAGGTGFALTVNGTNFIASSVVKFNGAARTTTFVSATQVTVAILAADIATAGTPSITVFNPAPGGGTSNAQTLTVNNSAPTITSLSPTGATAGGAAFTLTVNGTGFVASSVVNFNGAARTTTFVSTTQVTAAILASDIAVAGTPPVTVTNPAPGGGTSAPVTFNVSVANNPVPTLTSISPTSATAGGAAFALTLTGTNFIASSRVSFGANPPLTPTSQTATQLQVTVPAADITTGGIVSVTVTNPAPGGGTTTSQSFTINNPPTTLTSFSPASATAGGAAFTLTINGSNFVSGATGTFNGTARTVTFVSSTQVTMAVTAPDIATAGSFPVVVSNPGPAGGTNGALLFTVNNVLPTLTSISPTSATAGSAGFTLTLNGTGFVSGSTVKFGTAAPAATFVSSTQLTAAITAPDIVTAGVVTVSVTNPAPGGGTSGTQNFSINNPVPSITSFSPASASAGGAAFALTINGTNFVSGVTGTFNSTARTVTFVSATQVTMAVTAADIATGGSFPVIVSNPGPGGGASAAASFTVNNPAPTITTLSPTSATAGGAAFALTINGTNFVSTTTGTFNGVSRTVAFVSATQVTMAVTAGDIAAAGSFPVVVSNPAPGGGTSAATTFTVNNPAPTITSLNPNTMTAGGAAFTLTVNGTNFVSTSQVKFNNNAKTTTFVSATQLTAAILAGDIATSGNANVTVTNPTPGGGTTTNFVFVIATVPNPVPTLTSIAPTSGTLGQSVSLILTGTNFISASVVNFGANADSGGMVSNGGNTLTITIPAAQLNAAGPVSVTVTNPAPGGGTTTAQTFTVNNSVPAITTLSPSTATVGGTAFTLTVNGTGFANGAVVKFNGSAKATTFVSATQLTAAILATDIAATGNFPVTVTNPAPGGGTSPSVSFSVTNPPPVITSISPTSATAGGAAFTLTVNGTGFVNGAVVNFNGAAKTTAFVNATQLTAAILAADIASAGTVNVTVSNPAPGGGTSAAATFTINNPVPTIATLLPTSATAGGAAFTLTVNGTNFVATSVVNFNGVAKTTTFVNPAQLTAAITAADIAVGGTFAVTVTNAAPGGGTSAPTNFTVNNPVPTITALAPSSATAGGAAFTLTVNGTNFVTGQSLIKFNGTAKTTTVVSATQVTAPITAADIATAGTFPVTVTNAAPGGGTSAPTNFTANNPAPTITTLSPSSAIAGGAAFTLTVNGTNFVAGSVVNLSGAARATTFVSATQVTAAITAADIATAGTPSVTVTNPAPGGGTSAGVTFTINNPQPVLGSLSPASATAGGVAFTLTVNGSKFVNGAVVSFNGTAKTTVFVSAAQVTAAITAADIATGGTFNVIGTNPAPTVGPSAALPFNVNNPAPTVTNATAAGGKTHVSGGASFTLSVTGTNFVSASVINFNGKAETTTLVSNTQVTATIPASDVATAGNVNVTVTNPSPPANNTSAPFVFTVDGYSVSGPANTTVKAGAQATILITVTPTSLANGFTNAVALTVSGLPAHSTATFSSTTVTPGGAAATSTLTIMTTARGAAPPSAPVDPPVSPLLRLLPVLWLAAMLAGLYAMSLVRRNPVRRRYAAVVPLAMLLVTGAILAGCSGGRIGTPAGPAQLTITATSGTMVQTTPANSVTLTVQ